MDTRMLCVWHQLTGAHLCCVQVGYLHLTDAARLAEILAMMDD